MNVESDNNISYEIKNRKRILIEFNKSNYILFEGEFLNWKKNGKPKVYNDESKLIFEGEYLNGRKNGKGKESNNIGLS